MYVNITFLRGLRSPPDLHLRGHHLPFTQNRLAALEGSLLSSSPFSSGLLAPFELHFLTCSSSYILQLHSCAFSRDPPAHQAFT